jgi:hypothetical protein
MPSKSSLLHPSELVMLRVTLTAAVLDALLIAARGAAFDFAGYGAVVGMASVLLGLGFAYRRLQRSEAIGATATCAGLFILFTSALSLFNYVLVPNGRPVIDGWLIRADAVLGYDWPGIIAWAAQHPLFNDLMRLAYSTTLPQIALLVVVLGLSGRFRDLHSLMATVVVAGTFTVLFWGIFPSAGAKAFYELPQQLIVAVRPIVDPAYGAAILSLVRDGAPRLSPDELRGLVAFPSFHIVLALVATYHARNVWWLLVPYALINLIVLPAVLVHGGHHLVDIPAGAAVFLFAVFCARRMLEPKPAEASAALGNSAFG